MDHVVLSQAVSRRTVSDRIRQAPGNASILGHEAGPFGLTMEDLLSRELETSRLSHTMERMALRISPLLAYYNISDLRGAKFKCQVHPGLPDTIERSNHVFVVTKACESALQHWSVYSQGYFFHLSAQVPGNVTDRSELSRLDHVRTAGRRVNIPVRQHVENLSSPTTDDYVKASTGTSAKKPFIAYNFGKTQYSPTDIEQIGHWIVSRYQGYDLLAGNCQLFALSLLSRIVMANGDCSIFVGSKTQLAEWDLRGRHKSPAQAIPRSIDLGFLVRKPRKPRKLTMLSSFTSKVEFNGQSEIRAIRILYEHGPLAPGAADPTGGRGTWAYMWYLTRESGGVTKRQGKRACVEFIEDLKAGNYRDAFCGREALRQELMAQRIQDKQSGMLSLNPRDWFCTKGA